MDTNLITLLCGGVLVIGLFIGGVVSIITGIKNQRKGRASNSWPSAGGVITNAWIEEKTDTDDDGFTSHTYYPKWQYTFQAGGYEYTSQRVSYGAEKGYGRRGKAQEELNRFPANSRVRVYYDPRDPNESVLKRGAKGTLWGVITGIILIVVAAAIACGGGATLLANM
ncbi:MAG: DUF3592 domain-containing protein [Anaerolineales bacterium]